MVPLQGHADQGRPRQGRSLVRHQYRYHRELNTQRNLERSNAELQQFAYVASHDLQEPLRTITAYLALLNMKYGDKLDDNAKIYMAYVVDGADRMKALINDLLEFSRVDTQSKEFSTVNMNLVAAEVLDTLHLAIYDNKATIALGPLPTVLGDRTQLSQVLQNLTGNAIKYHGPEAPRIEITSRQNSREWIISVKDNGIGIDPQDLDKLFQMFQRLHTRDSIRGTGIGLAIAKKIIERHGGRIWFESEVGKGTTFFFTIPKVGN